MGLPRPWSLAPKPHQDLHRATSPWVPAFTPGVSDATSTRLGLPRASDALRAGGGSVPEFWGPWLPSLLFSSPFFFFQTLWFDLHQRLSDSESTACTVSVWPCWPHHHPRGVPAWGQGCHRICWVSHALCSPLQYLLLVRDEMTVSHKHLGEFCSSLKQYLKSVAGERDCFQWVPRGGYLGTGLREGGHQEAWVPGAGLLGPLYRGQGLGVSYWGQWGAPSAAPPRGSPLSPPPPVSPRSSCPTGSPSSSTSFGRLRRTGRGRTGWGGDAFGVGWEIWLRGCGMAGGERAGVRRVIWGCHPPPSPGHRHLQSATCKGFQHVKVDTLSQPEAISSVAVPGTTRTPLRVPPWDSQHPSRGWGVHRGG